MIELINCDCLEYMKTVPDKHFDLAIVDPPYGNMKKNTIFQKRGMPVLNWDTKPNKDYFNELKRVSKNQIIWGANYFNLSQPKSVLVWDKKNHFPLYGDAEIAFFFGKLIGMRDSGINMGGVKIYRELNKHENRIHPTQKPVGLYKYCLDKYAKEGDKILDTHLGSGSIAIACHEYKFDLVGCELDKDYYESALKRFNNHKAQQTLF